MPEVTTTQVWTIQAPYEASQTWTIRVPLEVIGTGEKVRMPVSSRRFPYWIGTVTWPRYKKAWYVVLLEVTTTQVFTIRAPAEASWTVTVTD